jgi:hypothetical protein
VKKSIIILSTLAFFYGFYIGSLPSHEIISRSAALGWWDFLEQQLNEDVQEVRVERSERIRNEIRAFRSDKILAGRAQQAQEAEKYLLAAEQNPESLDSAKKIVITQVKYPDLRIIAQDKNKNRTDLQPREADLISRVLSVLPSEAVNSFKQIIVDYGDLARRGMSGGGTMFIQGVSKMRGGNKEFIAVAVHEFGHLIDLAYHKGNNNSDPSTFKDGSQIVYENDPSVSFYKINWTTDTSKRPDTSKLNFISGYGSSDPFEDFAESYNAFVTQGEAFRTLAGNDNRLNQQYRFISDQLYGGKEFISGVDATQLDKDPRVYDTTVQPITDDVINSRL